jgi:hypothetical protein
MQLEASVIAANQILAKPRVTSSFLIDGKQQIPQRSYAGDL